MKNNILNIKLVEIPIVSGSQGNKKPNGCHLSNRGKSVKIVHAIGLSVPLSHKSRFQTSNGTIGINFNCKNLAAFDDFFPSK